MYRSPSRGCEAPHNNGCAQQVSTRARAQAAQLQVQRVFTDGKAVLADLKRLARTQRQLMATKASAKTPKTPADVQQTLLEQWGTVFSDPALEVEAAKR